MTTVTDTAPDLARCWCCGQLKPENEVVHLGEHPEVAVCLRCGHYLHQQARSREDAARPSIATRGRDVLRAGRREVMRHDLQHKPIIGPVLRWLGARLP
jgi:NMD protein affecting ribosome stability and mRNA decay